MGKDKGIIASIGETFSSFKETITDTEKTNSKDKTVKNQKLMKDRKNISKNLVQSEVSKATEDGSARVATSTTETNKPANKIIVNTSNTVVVLEPTETSDSAILVNFLKNRRTIMIKFDKVNETDRETILNWLYGACQFADYTLEPIGNQMILIDPNHNH